MNNILNTNNPVERHGEVLNLIQKSNEILVEAFGQCKRVENGQLLACLATARSLVLDDLNQKGMSFLQAEPEIGNRFDMHKEVYISKAKKGEFELVFVGFSAQIIWRD